MGKPKCIMGWMTFFWAYGNQFIVNQMLERGLLPRKHLRSRDLILLRITQMRSSKWSHKEVIHSYCLFFLVSIIVYKIYILWSNIILIRSSITIYMRDRSLPMIPSQCCRLLLYKETLKRIHLLFDPSANISSLSKYNA